jgi:hypothetical protein
MFDVDVDMTFCSSLLLKDRLALAGALVERSRIALLCITEERDATMRNLHLQII